MARYVYHCPVCRRQYEIDKSMSRATEAEPCPVCGKTGERVFTAPGIQIKGAKVKCDQSESQCHCHGCEHGCCDLE